MVEIYTLKYFKELGLSKQEAKFFAPRWNTIFGNGGKSPRFPGVVGQEFDPETGDFRPRLKTRKRP